MNKNVKGVFFVLTLLAIILAVSTVNAVDNDTTDINNDISQDTASNMLSEQRNTISDNNMVKTDNTNDKEYKISKEIKTSTKTVEVNDFNEFTTALTEAANDEEADDYIINLNEGNYPVQRPVTINSTNTKIKNITIYGNNQTIYTAQRSPRITIDITSNILFVEINLNTSIVNYNNVSFNKSNLDSVGQNSKYTIWNSGNLSIFNSTINTTISNDANLKLYSDNILLNGFQLAGNGTIECDDITSLFPYIQELSGNYTIENTEWNFTKANSGNLTLINCDISNLITNNANGNLTLINCSFKNNNCVESTGVTTVFIRNNQNATAILINVSVLNNTYNSTNGHLIDNMGYMEIINSTFQNNTMGDSYQNESDPYGGGPSYGEGLLMNYQLGTIVIDNSRFDNNFAGFTGGSILSRGNMNISNSIFTNNTAGKTGGAIAITNGTVYITKTNFTSNHVEVRHSGGTGVTSPFTGGAIVIDKFNTPQIEVYINESSFTDNGITNPNNIGTPHTSKEDNAIKRFLGNLTIDNCYFTDNFALDSGDTASTYRNNINDEVSITNSYFNEGVTLNVVGILKNVTNNTLNNKGSIVDTTTNINKTRYITQNTFNNSGTIKIKENTSFIIQDNTYLNSTINDTLTLEIPSKIYTDEAITITGEYKVNTPYCYDEDLLEKTQFNVYINGLLNQTLDTLEFTVTPTAENMIVTVQPTISQTRKTVSIKATTLTNILITPENYNEYIYEGALIGVGKDSKITFQGDFTDKGEIYIDTSDMILDGSDATFTNTQFVLDAENIIIQNMKINNTNTNYPITNSRNNNIIKNNNIIVNNPNSNATAILNKANNTIITNNTLTVTALPGSIDFSNGAGVADTQAILLLGGDKNTVQNNNINIKSTQATGYNTLEAITNNNHATNTLITQNNINISDANFNYAIDSLNNVENITITQNNINVDGERYCDGIQVGNGANNIIIEDNNITCTCINTTVLDYEGAITYGVIATSMGSAESNNITITNNNIDITGTANYAIELYKVNNTEIHSNNITVTGSYSLGIGYSYAPNGNATQNTITINGDSTTPINYITEEIKPENTGIRIQNGTQNITITDNTITTNDIGGQDTTIHTDESTVTIKDNQLTSSQGYGADTINAPTDAIIENNIIETSTTIEDITALTNTPTTITATVTTANGDNITGGTVTFTDSTGNTIGEATVTDGTATATATFTQSGESTITAAYTPTSIGLTTSTTTATVTVKDKFQTTITIDEITASAGETITLTAHVTDENGDAVTMGKVTFKINGKTVKDANGKVVYAKVVDGVATAEYTVPAEMNGKNLNITAVYSGSNKYDKATESITTTVAKSTPTITTSNITATAGSTITLTATITDGDNAINTGKVVFKINGKTVKDTNGKVIYAKVVNNQVTVEYTVPADMKAKEYNITAVFTSTDYDKLEDTKILTVTA